VALSNHPALKSAEADVTAANAQHAAAQAALSPRLDLELGANRDRDRIQGRVDERTAMLRLRYNLWRGGSDQARIEETRFQLYEATDMLNRTRRQVEESLSLAFNATLTAHDRVVTLRQYVESSSATRAAYAKQFGIGQRTLLDLLNAENEYFSARLAYLFEQYLELASMFRVFAGMGQLLSTLQVSLPVTGDSQFEAVGPSE
jgi:adhesin transport system outer membrane protein